MGRNGAGKSTLLRHAAGLMRPTRGKVRSAGRVALLLQNPTDYLVHERVRAGGLGRARSPPSASATRVRRPPSARPLGRREAAARARDRARRVAGGDLGYQTAVVCLDEPTRGMDRRRKDELAALLRELDAAVLVATHDPEFVAAFAQRVILLADGALIADGSPARDPRRRHVLRHRDRADPRRRRAARCCPTKGSHSSVRFERAGGPRWRA